MYMQWNYWVRFINSSSFSILKFYVSGHISILYSELWKLLTWQKDLLIIDQMTSSCCIFYVCNLKSCLKKIEDLENKTFKKKRTRNRRLNWFNEKTCPIRTNKVIQNVYVKVTKSDIYMTSKILLRRAKCKYLSSNLEQKLPYHIHCFVRSQFFNSTWYYVYLYEIMYAYKLHKTRTWFEGAKRQQFCINLCYVKCK